MRIFYLSLALCVVSLAGAASAQIDPYKDKRGYGGVLYETPVYDPQSKSYFELIYVGTPGKTWGASYGAARKLVRGRIHNGVRGRLAIIRSRETQKFLNNTFKPKEEIWIGLRMFCRGRVLFWVDGKKLDRSKEYSNWGREWHYRKSYLPCRGGDKYAGILLKRFEGAMRWFAIDPNHHVKYAFIEYPTGRR